MVSTTGTAVLSGAWAARSMGGVHFSSVAVVFSANTPLRLPQRQVTVSEKAEEARLILMVISWPSTTPPALREDTRGICGRPT